MTWLERQIDRRKPEILIASQEPHEMVKMAKLLDAAKYKVSGPTQVSKVTGDLYQWWYLEDGDE